MDAMKIPPAKPYFHEEDMLKINDEVQKILQSGMLTLGEYTKRFEIEFAKFCKVKQAVAVSSGTSALEIVLRSIGLKSNDEVLVPTNTFTSTASAVVFAGGRPVLTDVSSKSLCIDVKNIQKNLTAKTKGIIVVHIGGLICPELSAIKELCENSHLFLIEDAAHAHGSTIDTQPAGSIGDAGCFSFYPTKVMTTGEGGIITTNKETIAQKATILRDQGKENFSSNNIIELGYNWRMNEISAAIGFVQLRRVLGFIEHRNEIAQYYDKELSKISGIKPLEVPSNIRNNYYKYVTFLDPEIDREEFKRKLRDRGVRCSGEVYWPPLHLQPVYQRLLGVKEGTLPVAEEICRRMVCLPIYSNMTPTETEYVVEKIHEVLSM